MDILDKSLDISGTDLKSFISAREEFESKSKMYVDDFSDLSFEIFWFYHTNSSEFISFYVINNDTFEQVNSGTMNIVRKKFRKNDVPVSILNGIKNQEIPCALHLSKNDKDIIYFMDKICFSRIAAKVQISAILDEQNIFNALSLYNGLKKFKNPLVTILRTQDGYWRMMSVGSTSTKYPNAIELIKDEMSKTGFSFASWNITQCVTSVVLEGPAVGDFVPCVTLNFSDTGHGILKKIFGLKTKNSKTAIYFKEYNSDDEFEIAYELLLMELNKISISKNEKMKNINFLTGKKIHHAIGKKRISKLNDIFTEDMPVMDAYLKLIQVPDIIGSINHSSDMEMKFALGTIFSTGVSSL